MGIHVDASDVDRLAAELAQGPARMKAKAPKVLEVGANKVKKGMKREASGHTYLPDLPNFVSYDRVTPMLYEIGFDKVGQGNLANIAAFGSVNNAPVMDHTAALHRELPVILRHIGEAAEDAVLGGEG